MATTLGAGLPLPAALDHSLSGAPPDVSSALRDAVRSGRTLADGMAQVPGTFEKFAIALVRGAETAGNLEEAALDLASMEEERDRVRGSVLAATAYPALVLLGVPVPLHIGSLLQEGLGAFVLLYLATALPFVLPLVAAVILWKRPGGRRFLSTLLMAVPVLGAVLRARAWARWARAMAALEDAGIPADVAARESAAVAGLPPLVDRLEASSRRLGHGTSRTEAFADAGLPGALRDSLATGEVSGSLAESLRAAASGLQHEADTKTQVLLAALPVAITVLAGAAVLYAAFKVLGPVYGGL